jgi:hypothetical protein
MKRMFRAVLAVVTTSIVPTALFAKGETIKITIEGPGISVPIESTDGKVRDFQVWAGPEVRINGVEQTEGFIIDWVHGPVAEPSAALSRYQVSFYVSGRVNGLAYVVSYAVDPKTGRGFVYLPGKGDEQYPRNAASMYHGHGLEGNWFRATTAWESFVNPLIAQAR